MLECCDRFFPQILAVSYGRKWDGDIQELVEGPITDFVYRNFNRRSLYFLLMEHAHEHGEIVRFCKLRMGVQGTSKWGNCKIL